MFDGAIGGHDPSQRGPSKLPLYTPQTSLQSEPGGGPEGGCLESERALEFRSLLQ